MDVTLTQVNSYLLKNKKRGEVALSLLGQYQGFINAWNTEVGKEILGDLVTRYETILKAIAELTATDAQKIEFTVVKTLLTTYGDKVDKYYQLINDIKTNKI